MILGSRMPRVFTPPLRPLTRQTSLGFEAIDVWATVFGKDLMPHQEEILVRSLELAPGSTTADEFPRLRFKTVLLLMARQNGKTYVMTARGLWRMLMWSGPGEPAPVVLGLAHRLGPTEEILEKAIQQLKAAPAAAGLIAKRSDTNGNKYVRLRSGAKWLTQAATDDAGRSESVTDVLFDELRQQRSWDAWTAAENTTNSIFSSQTLGVSNAGEAKSTVLRGLRTSAMKEAESLRAHLDAHGTAEGWAGDASICILEWSAPEGADVDDVGALAQANPAMNREQNGRVFLTSEDLLSKAARIGQPGEDGLPEHKYRTENMCQWVTVAAEPTFPPEQVEACTDPRSEIAAGSPLVYSVDTSVNDKTSWIAVAGWRADESVHVEVIAKRRGTHWISGFLKDLEEPGPVVIQGRGAPASSLITWLANEGFDVRKCEGSEQTNALTQLDDAISEGTIRWRPQGALLRAMKDTARKRTGEVALLDRYNSPIDAAPLCAGMFARWGLVNLDLAKTTSAYADDYADWYQTGDSTPEKADEDWRWWDS